jgi:hypothetical protein
MEPVGSAVPADPRCVYTQDLFNRAPCADGLGNPVERNARWGTSYVKVSIPRCEACRLRNRLSDFLTISGSLVGAYWGLQFPSMGITTIIGAVVWVLLALYYRRMIGLRPLKDYPTLKRLRESG